MFTIKLYANGDFRCVVRSAESFTILRDQSGEAEITMHQKNQGDDCRVDIRREPNEGEPVSVYAPPIYQRAIIENASGRTTEIIGLRPA